MSMVREACYQALERLLDQNLDIAVIRDEMGRQRLSEMAPFAVLYTAPEPEVLEECLSVQHYELRDDATLELYLQDREAEGRNQLIAEFTAAVAAVAHRSTLGGLAQHVDVRPATIDHQGVQGAAGVAYCQIPISIFYESSQPTG